MGRGGGVVSPCPGPVCCDTAASMGCVVAWTWRVIVDLHMQQQCLAVAWLPCVIANVHLLCFWTWQVLQAAHPQGRVCPASTRHALYVGPLGSPSQSGSPSESSLCVYPAHLFSCMGWLSHTLPSGIMTCVNRTEKHSQLVSEHVQ